MRRFSNLLHFGCLHINEFVKKWFKRKNPAVAGFFSMFSFYFLGCVSCLGAAGFCMVGAPPSTLGVAVLVFR
jgi:hypothetical protein